MGMVEMFDGQMRVSNAAICPSPSSSSSSSSEVEEECYGRVVISWANDTELDQYKTWKKLGLFTLK